MISVYQKVLSIMVCLFSDKGLFISLSDTRYMDFANVSMVTMGAVISGRIKLSTQGVYAPGILVGHIAMAEQPQDIDTVRARVVFLQGQIRKMKKEGLARSVRSRLYLCSQTLC